MFHRNKREKEEAAANERARRFTVQEQPEQPRKPSVLEILKARRATKMDEIKRLDREIAQLDQDITYIERYPHHARVLEFISARFTEEPTP
jgi:hypothetical protein